MESGSLICLKFALLGGPFVVRPDQWEYCSDENDSGYTLIKRTDDHKVCILMKDGYGECYAYLAAGEFAFTQEEAIQLVSQMRERALQKIEKACTSKKANLRKLQFKKRRLMNLDPAQVVTQKLGAPSFRQATSKFRRFVTPE